MTWWQAAIVLVAGIWAGTINAVVGSGTLVTFPVLVALGYPPIVANTSNSIGLAPGTIAGAVGYRKELTGMWPRVIRYGIASFFGAVVGAVLLLVLPADAFKTIVPVLIALAVVLVIIQPRVSAYLAKRREKAAENGGARRQDGPLLFFLIFLIGIYGGYFTAAQGIMLMAVMSMLLSDSLQSLNGVKNVLSAVANVVSGAIYAVVADVSWLVVLMLAVGSTLGGFLGAKIGRKLKPAVLRGVIVVIGLAAIVQFLLK